MRATLLQILLERQPADAAGWRYAPGAESFWLLRQAVGGAGSTVKALKQSRYRALLDRPDIKAVLSKQGHGRLRSTMFEDTHDLHECVSYRVSLGGWGVDWPRVEDWTYYQLTRPGWNLVVRLDFDETHDAAYRRLIRNHDHRPFDAPSHPTAKIDRCTLAWARIDLSLDTSEALIEEVQSDWLRRADAAFSPIASKEPNHWTAEDFFARAYVEDILSPHRVYWAEATLLAAMRYLRRELRIEKIYLHDYECGNYLKWIERQKPPRSVYEKLPRRFCFEPTTEGPEFLKISENKRYKSLKRRGDLKFWRFDF